MSNKPVIERLSVGQLATNAYLITAGADGETFIVDPGDDAQFIIGKLTRDSRQPLGILLTHGHFDHILGAFEIQATFGIPVYMNYQDSFLLARMNDTAKHFLGITVVEPPPMVDHPIKDGDSLTLGNETVSCVAIPGHTPGSMGFSVPSAHAFFCGDVLFSDGTVGRTDHKYASPLTLARSVDTVLSYPDDTILYPGHGEEIILGDLKFKREHPEDFRP